MPSAWVERGQGTPLPTTAPCAVALSWLRNVATSSESEWVESNAGGVGELIWRAIGWGEGKAKLATDCIAGCIVRCGAVLWCGRLLRCRRRPNQRRL